jgi:hypothetical protein
MLKSHESQARREVADLSAVPITNKTPEQI